MGQNFTKYKNKVNKKIYIDSLLSIDYYFKGENWKSFLQWVKLNPKTFEIEDGVNTTRSSLTT